MPNWRDIAEPLAVAVLWAVTALASDAIQSGAGVTLLLWIPAGIAVAALRIFPMRKWPAVLAVLSPTQFAVFAFMGEDTGTALLFALASTVQSMIVAAFSSRIVRGRRTLPGKFRHVVGLFGAAVLGSLVGACIAYGLREEPSLAEFTWWALANLIGIMTLTPIYIKLRGYFTSANQRIDKYGARELALVLPMFALLSWAVLEYHSLLVAPLLVTALMLITFRFGEQTSALCVFTFAIVAAIINLQEGSPLPATDLSQGEATLTLQIWMFILLATRLPLATMIQKQDQLQIKLVDRNAQMHESLMLFDLAEETAGIGRWRLNLVTGEQDWSPKMLDLTGVAQELGPDPGDVSDLMPDGGERFYGQIAENRANRDTYSFTYRVKPPDRPERILRISILNEYDIAGTRIGVFGVAMDVTEQVRREEALDLARSRAVLLAAEAQKLANTDPLTSLPNRRFTFGRLDSMIEVAGTRERDLTAIMFDIDHFKRVNDVYGHQTGDEVLVQVAELARRQARSGDVVGRIGGEEFVWLISGMGETAARKLAERLRGSIEKGIEGSNLPRVTVSIGMAHFRAGDDEESLMARADAALYEAKESGRNQVRLAA